MMVPPLSERPVTDEDEEQFRRESTPRKYTLRRRWADYRAEVKARRPKGAKARVRAWMDADIVDWGIRTSITLLIIAGLYAIYTNGVTNGWWPAWGERPTVAATTTPPINPTPSASATASGEAAMSGGYQIGPDGVLVRPAEHAASTYTKPELPEEAKQNTEEGAEAAARHYLDLIVYAWNTGDTQPLADMSTPTSKFASTYVRNIDDLYTNGWAYETSSVVDQVISVEPITPNGTDVPEGSILVTLHISSRDGVKCYGLRTKDNTEEYGSTMSFIMSWNNGKWMEVQGKVEADHAQS